MAGRTCEKNLRVAAGSHGHDDRRVVARESHGLARVVGAEGAVSSLCQFRRRAALGAELRSPLPIYESRRSQSDLVLGEVEEWILSASVHEVRVGEVFSRLESEQRSIFSEAQELRRAKASRKRGGVYSVRNRG